MTLVYFYGVWKEPGHYLFDKHGRMMRKEIVLHKTIVDKRVDGGFCPPLRRYDDSEIEGRAVLHNMEGWTILSFWDRSADHRLGSHSTYFLKGTYGFDEAVKTAREAYPAIWSRYGFTVTKA